MARSDGQLRLEDRPCLSGASHPPAPPIEMRRPGEAGSPITVRPSAWLRSSGRDRRAATQRRVAPALPGEETVDRPSNDISSFFPGPSSGSPWACAGTWALVRRSVDGLSLGWLVAFDTRVTYRSDCSPSIQKSGRRISVEIWHDPVPTMLPASEMAALMPWSVDLSRQDRPQGTDC